VDGGPVSAGGVDSETGIIQQEVLINSRQSKRKPGIGEICPPDQGAPILSDV
jgi:hypothetical protein